MFQISVYRSDVITTIGVTFLCPYKKVTKENVRGMRCPAKPFVTAWVNRPYYPDFEPPSPGSCCGARNFLLAVRSRNFDRCHSLSSLYLPPAALASLPPTRPPSKDRLESILGVDTHVRIILYFCSGFGSFDYCLSFD